MILIWDNEDSYSAHEIAFYDCADWPLEDIKTLGVLLCEYRGGSVVGIVTEIEWSGWTREPHEVFDLFVYGQGGTGIELVPEHSSVLRRCMPKVLEHAVLGVESLRRQYPQQDGAYVGKRPRPRPMPHHVAEQLEARERLVAKILELTKEKT